MFNIYTFAILVLSWIAIDTVCKDEESSKEIDA